MQFVSESYHNLSGTGSLHPYDEDNDADEEDEEYDDDDSEYTPRHYMDDDGRYYDEESWYESHSNPPGTIDCGDGYIDDDGVFTEY